MGCSPFKDWVWFWQRAEGNRLRLLFIVGLSIPLWPHSQPQDFHDVQDNFPHKFRASSWYIMNLSWYISISFYFCLMRLPCCSPFTPSIRKFRDLENSWLPTGDCRASKAARDRVGEWHLHGLHVIPGETPRPFFPMKFGKGWQVWRVASVTMWLWMGFLMFSIYIYIVYVYVYIYINMHIYILITLYQMEWAIVLRVTEPSNQLKIVAPQKLHGWDGKNKDTWGWSQTHGCVNQKTYSRGFLQHWD